MSSGLKPLGAGFASGLTPPTTIPASSTTAPIKSINEQIQKQKQTIIKIYCEWANHYLGKRYNELHEAFGEEDTEAETGGSRLSLASSSSSSGIKKPGVKLSAASPTSPASIKRRLITNLATDLQDGVLLVYIVESVTDTSLNNGTTTLQPKTSKEMISNIDCCLHSLHQTGVNIKGILAKDIHEGNLKSILTLFFNISRYKQTLKQVPSSTTTTTTSVPPPPPTASATISPPSSFGFKSSAAGAQRGNVDHALCTPFSSTTSIAAAGIDRPSAPSSATAQHQLNSSLPNLSPSPPGNCPTSIAMLSRYNQCDTSSSSTASLHASTNHRTFGVKQSTAVNSTGIPVGGGGGSVASNNTTASRKLPLTGKHNSVPGTSVSPPTTSPSSVSSPTSSSASSISPTSTTPSTHHTRVSKVPGSSSTFGNNNTRTPRPSSTSSIPQIPATTKSTAANRVKASGSSATTTSTLHSSSRIASLAKSGNVDTNGSKTSTTSSKTASVSKPAASQSTTSQAAVKYRLSSSNRTSNTSTTPRTNGTLKRPPSIIGRHRPISTIVETGTTTSSPTASIPSAMASSASSQLLSSTTSAASKQSSTVSTTITKPTATVKATIVTSTVMERKEEKDDAFEKKRENQNAQNEPEVEQLKGGSGGSANDSNGEEDAESSSNDSSDIEAALANIEPMQPIMERPHHMSYLKSSLSGADYPRNNGIYASLSETNQTPAYRDAFGQRPNGSAYRQHNGDSDNTESSLKIGTSQEPETTTTTTSTTVNDEKIMATMRQHLSSSNTLLNRVTPRARSKHVKSAEFTLLRLDETSSLSSDPGMISGTDASGTTTTTTSSSMGSSSNGAAGAAAGVHKYTLNARHTQQQQQQQQQHEYDETRRRMLKIKMAAGNNSTTTTTGSLTRSSIDHGEVGRHSPRQHHHQRSTRSKSEVNAKISSASLQQLTNVAAAADAQRMLSGSSGDLTKRPLSLSGSKMLQSSGTLPSNSSSTSTVCGGAGNDNNNNNRSIRNSHPSQQRYLIKSKLRSQHQMAGAGMSSNEQICSDSECLNSALYRQMMPTTSAAGGGMIAGNMRGRMAGNITKEDYGSIDSTSTIYSNIDNNYHPHQPTYMNGPSAAGKMYHHHHHHHHQLGRNAFTDTESMESLNFALNYNPSHQSIGGNQSQQHQQQQQQQQQQLPVHPYYTHLSKPGDLICEYETVNRMRETMSASPTGSAYALAGGKLNGVGGGGASSVHYGAVGVPENANPILVRSGSFRSTDGNNHRPPIPAHMNSLSHKRHSEEANQSGGSSLSLLSTTSSMFTTPEEKYIHEIRRLRRELEQANEKILTLTSQLTANAHMVAAFEQSLSSMTNRMQQLSSTSELKDCELDRLRQTIENLKQHHQDGQQLAAKRSTLPPKYKSLGTPATAADLDQSSNNESIVPAEAHSRTLPLSDSRSHLLIRRHTFTNPLNNHNFTAVSPTTTTTATVYHIEASPLYDKFQRHLSSESVNSVASDGTKKKKSKLKIVGNNTNWIRSSFSRAFKKNKPQPGGSANGSPVKGQQGEILSDAETIEENGGDNSRSVPSSPLMSIRSFHSSNSNESKVSEGKEGEVISQLRKQLRDKDMQMTEMRLESLTSAHQLENLKEAMNQMRLELSNLRQDNDRLQRLANTKSLASSQSSMTSAFGSHGSSTVPSSNNGNNLASPPAVLPTSTASVNNSHSLESIEIDLPTGGCEQRLVTLGSGSHTLTTMTIGTKTSWEQMDQIVKQSFKEHLLRLDVQLSLGITVDSLACYLVGKMQRKFVNLGNENTTEPGRSPYETLQPDSHVSVQFKSVLDSLAFDTLTPKSILSRLITLLMETGRLMLAGASGTGKTYLAHKLAEYLAVKQMTDVTGSKAMQAGGGGASLMHSPSMSSAGGLGGGSSLFDPITTSGAIVSFNVDHKNAKELRAYMANIVEQCELVQSGGDLLQPLPTVIIFDNLHHLDSLGDIFNVLQKFPQPNSPYIIGTYNQNISSKVEVLQMYNFRWSMLTINSEPVSGFLNHFLRRKLLETEAKLTLGGQKPCNEMVRIVDWISSVCNYLNKYLAGYFGDRLCIGPRLFTSCPMDLNTSQRWFTDLWNFSILPFLIENMREELRGKVAEISFVDPTEWIIDNFPWTASAEWSDHLNRLRPEDIVEDGEQLGLMQKNANNLNNNGGQADANGDIEKINDPFLQMLIKLKEASDYSTPSSHAKSSPEGGTRSDSRASTHSHHRAPIAAAHIDDI